MSFSESLFAGDRDFAAEAIASLLDSGWLSILRKTELVVLLAYVRQADPFGVAELTARELQAIAGHASPGEVAHARVELVALGLLDRSESGSGECQVRLDVPAPDTRRPARRPSRSRPQFQARSVLREYTARPTPRWDRLK